MTGTRIPESHGQQRRAWRNLRGTLAPRPTLSQLIVGLLCFLLGLSIAAQVGQREEDSLQGASQQELLRLLDESGRHVDSLEDENAELDRTLASLEAGQEDDAAAQSAAAERLEDLEILAGTVPAEGRGVHVTISDPTGSVSTGIVLGVVQELRNAGAEVLQIGPVRVIASTSITAGADGSIVVDGTEIPSPYVIRAIGDPTVMEPALKIPGGAADSVSSAGGTFTVRTEDKLRIDAVRELAEPTHSQVVK
ncbi:DUF881 domain-containing protein [Brachybacterium sp. p3-SID1565]|uniref:DUF881 domain-containing protein n=1 Tax=Brachybacterium sp. p3-SID1565 TaxID=2916046 RepID=UPI0021A277F7|nr:DUF881 domain-containing protein [Brachybacterium sp. p3-SID1565]MCT1385877.1 DUF881 domain-containing protein [Brachybacterium sp. p3-SID1565]